MQSAGGFSDSSRFPVSTKKRCVSIDGTKIEFIHNVFSNQQFLIVTALEKIGTLVSISKDECKVMMGNREDIRIDVISKQIQNFIADLDTKPLILSIGLPKESNTPLLVKKLIPVLEIILKS